MINKGLSINLCGTPNDNSDQLSYYSYSLH